MFHSNATESGRLLAMGICLDKGESAHRSFKWIRTGLWKHDVPGHSLLSYKGEGGRPSTTQRLNQKIFIIFVFVICSVHICVNMINWLRNPWGQEPFLLCRSDSACVSRHNSETNQSRPSQVRRPRWPAPSKYPCPPVAGLQDWATSLDGLCGQQESNLGFHLVELQCNHWAIIPHKIYRTICE